jgi:hypothetical protein
MVPTIDFIGQNKRQHLSKRSEPSAHLPLFGEIIGSYATTKRQQFLDMMVVEVSLLPR